MPVPLIYVAGVGAVAAGAALHAWLTSQPADAWEDKDVFNARMRDMHSNALALNEGFAHCADFRKDAALLKAWQGVRDGFGAFYKDVGLLGFSSPSDEQILQAKDYASKFYFWNGQYDVFKCGHAIIDPSTPKPDAPIISQPAPVSSPIDWASTIKWGAIVIGGVTLVRFLQDLLPARRR